MRLRQLSAAVLLLLTSFVYATAEDCACTAEDSSCSANISCPGGCLALCPSEGCTGHCVGEEGGSGERPVTTGTPEGSSVKAEMASSKRITIKAVKADGKQVAAELTRVTDRKIEFTQRRAADRFDFEFKNTELWDVLNYLSDFGVIKIDGTDFEQLKKIRRSLAGNQKVSMCLRAASVKDVASYLSFLSGVSVSVTSGDDKTRVTASLKEVTLSEIVSSISAQTGVEIATAGDAPKVSAAVGGTFIPILLSVLLPLMLT